LESIFFGVPIFCRNNNFVLNNVRFAGRHKGHYEELKLPYGTISLWLKDYSSGTGLANYEVIDIDAGQFAKMSD